MAARKQRWHPEEVRQRIQASQLINRLSEHANSSQPLMDNSQVAAARILLNKVLPDLSSTTLTGDPDNPIQHKVEADEAFAKLISALELAAQAKSGSSGGAGGVAQ